jgi:hypothetical protein
MTTAYRNADGSICFSIPQSKPPVQLPDTKISRITFDPLRHLSRQVPPGGLGVQKTHRMPIGAFNGRNMSPTTDRGAPVSRRRSAKCCDRQCRLSSAYWRRGVMKSLPGLPTKKKTGKTITNVCTFACFS